MGACLIRPGGVLTDGLQTGHRPVRVDGGTPVVAADRRDRLRAGHRGQTAGEDESADQGTSGRPEAT